MIGGKEEEKEQFLNDNNSDLTGNFTGFEH